MGTFSKLMCGAALVAGVGALAGAATLEIVLEPPSVQFVGAPDSVKRGEKFTVTGVAIPSVGSTETQVVVTVTTDHRNGNPNVQRASSFVINVVGDTPAPFEIGVRASGSGGTVRVSATITSTSPDGGAATSISEIGIDVTSGGK